MKTQNSGLGPRLRRQNFDFSLYSAVFYWLIQRISKRKLTGTLTGLIQSSGQRKIDGGEKSLNLKRNRKGVN